MGTHAPGCTRVSMWDVTCHFPSLQRARRSSRAPWTSTPPGGSAPAAHPGLGLICGADLWSPEPPTLARGCAQITALLLLWRGRCLIAGPDKAGPVLNALIVPSL